jgi:UDP:flavonoid glycosyltransferase YjiC (YdhE family)
MRIVIAVEGTRGDVHPMLALGEALRARGRDVVFCAPPDFEERVSRSGLGFRPVGTEIRPYLEREAQSLHDGATGIIRASDRFFRANLAAQFRDLASGAEGAELVLAAGTQFAAASVAELVGAEYRFVAYDPTLFPSREHPPFSIPRGEVPRWLNRVAWRTQHAATQLRMRPAVNRERAKVGLPPIDDLYARCMGTRPILAAEELLAPAPSDVKEVQTIGCLHPFEEAPLPEKLEAFLAAGPAPIYLGFGSMTDPDPGRTTRLVLEAVRRAGVRAVLSEGWAGLARIPLPEEVMAVGPLPHASLFQRVSAVIHHGGAGTTTMAARAGTPQILIPHVLDQFHWAHRVERLGLGPPAIPRRRLEVDWLCATIRATQDNDVLSERAAEIGLRLRAALSERANPADVIA